MLWFKGRCQSLRDTAQRITWANKSGETWEMTAQELERLLDAVKAAKLHGHGEVVIGTELNLEINNNG